LLAHLAPIHPLCNVCTNPLNICTTPENLPTLTHFNSRVSS
jgi:hypothetical protein